MEKQLTDILSVLDLAVHHFEGFPKSCHSIGYPDYIHPASLKPKSTYLTICLYLLLIRWGSPQFESLWLDFFEVLVFDGFSIHHAVDVTFADKFIVEAS